MNDRTATSALSPRFTVASTATVEPSRASPARAEAISVKHEAVTLKAEAHFEKHRQIWTNRQYGQLLAGDGARMSLRPQGMIDDRKVHLMRAADHLVRQKQALRLNKIDRAAKNMMAGKKESAQSHEIGR